MIDAAIVSALREAEYVTPIPPSSAPPPIREGRQETHFITADFVSFPPFTLLDTTPIYITFTMCVRYTLDIAEVGYTELGVDGDDEI